MLIDPHQKDDINKKAFDKFKKEHGVVPQMDSAAPSERFEGKGEKRPSCRVAYPVHLSKKVIQNLLKTCLQTNLVITNLRSK